MFTGTKGKCGPLDPYLKQLHCPYADNFVKLLFQLRQVTYLFVSVALICLVLYLKKIKVSKNLYCIVLFY